MILILEKTKRIVEVNEITCFPFPDDPRHILAYPSNRDNPIVIASNDNKCTPDTESEEVTWENMTIFQKWDVIKEKILDSTNGVIQLPI